jgi:mannitol-1-phosphate 5-dehydrogenase
MDLAGIIARGIKERYHHYPDRPIDIILAENVRDAALLLSSAMAKRLKKFPLDSYVGFVETSIGKMVPLMTKEQTEEDPLSIFAEPYNELILDKLAFRGPIPDVPELRPKENMQAWVDRKIFIHNLGHAVLAYQAFYSSPGLKYTWEALSNDHLHGVTRQTMIQSAQILQKLYPDEFTMNDLKDHIDDLLFRFSNKALGDTIFRVGADLERKLGPDDRLMLPVIKGLELELPVDLIMEAWVKGCHFAPQDEEGNYFRKDIKFNQKFKQDPGRILREHCKFTPLENPEIFRQLAFAASKLKNK